MCHLQVVELLRTGETTEAEAAGAEAGSRTRGGATDRLLRLNLLHRPTTAAPTGQPTADHVATTTTTQIEHAQHA
jgi:hypothetical protein